MNGWRGWASGRQLWLPVVLWLASLVVAYFWWWASAEGPWGPFHDPHYAQVLTVAPSLAGAVALIGILPRCDWVDAQAVTHPRTRDTLAAGLILVAFAAVPRFVGWTLPLSGLHLLFVPDGWHLSRDAPFGFVGVEVGIVLAATLLATSVVGRFIGPLTGPVWLLTLLAAQGYRLAPTWLPRMDETPSWHFAVLGTVTAAVGVAAFRVTASGAKPLIG